MKSTARKIRYKIIQSCPYMVTKNHARPDDFPILLSTSAKNINKKLKAQGGSSGPATFIFSQDIKELTEKFNFNNMHPTIRSMFLEGKYYKETTQYQQMLQAVRAYRSGETNNPALNGAYWCKSEADIDKYFEILEDCYKSIKKNGFLSQEELALKTGGKIGDGYIVRSLQDEINILIDFDGSLVFSSRRANHRFSIAKMLNINVIPVTLGGIHETWLRKNILTHCKTLPEIIREITYTHEHLSPYQTTTTPASGISLSRDKYQVPTRVF